MAGGIGRFGETLVRFGQDGSGAYGNGVYAFKIAQLSSESYLEEELGSFRFRQRKGPHTVNFSPDKAVVDWYRERFSLLAGIRRFKGRA